jgi:putative colanic acid biosynthesis acetyltransferase WcaF
MSEFACLGPKVTCYNIEKIVIGEHAIVSQGAHLCTGSHDIDSAQFQLIAQPIVVRDFAWIAAEAFVGPGVTVGEGAVLGARGVAFEDLAPWSVFRGNPATFMRDRLKAERVAI